jgi:hypothetical protein
LATAPRTAVWPLPARAVDHLVLDSREATAAYWGAVFLVVSGLFVTHLLPCVDYPQHLALADVVRRLWDPASPVHGTYQLNYFTYNGLFHIAVAAMSTVLPIELAGRLVVAASLVATSGAVVALVRVLRRPPVHAALFTPILFSFSVGWGFVNYVLSTALVAWALVFVARAATRPSVAAALSVGVIGSACAFAHVLGMLILCLLAGGLSLEMALRTTPAPPAGSGPRGRAWWALGVAGRVACATLPLVIGCVYCIAVNSRQYAWDPNMYRDPTIEGSAPPLWQKAVFFGAFATDLFGDATDQILLWLSVGVMGWAAWIAWPWRRRAEARDGGAGERGEVEESPPILAPFLCMLAAYLATPMVLLGTHLIFPRLAQWTVLGGVLAMPRFPAHLQARARAWMLRLGLVAGVNTVAHCALFDWETRDASALIDDLPVGQAATAVIWDPWTIAFRNGTLTHLAAYYGARKHGRWAFAFARYLSVPVRFREFSQPAWPRLGWEFSAEDYNPRCKYARAFPLVIVKAPAWLPRDASGEAPVRRLVFKEDARAPRLLSHHDRYWAFDTVGLPDDGTF